MKLVSNGITKEVNVLRHFKMGNEEYVLYKNTDNVSIGLIVQDKIFMPNAEKIPVLMKVLGNLINDTPVEEVNIQNNCVLLDNNIDACLEEISFQNVNIPNETLIKLFNPIVMPTTNIVTNQTPTKETVKPKKRHGGIVILVFIIIVLLGGALYIFKDKIGGLLPFGNMFNSNKTIDGIEILDGYNTYAARSSMVSSDTGKVAEYMEIVLRYDSKGELKYYQYTDNYPVDTEEEAANKSDAELQEIVNERKCKSVLKLDYEEFGSICQVKNRVYTYGYSITDKTIAAGVLNNKSDNGFLADMLKDFDRISTEEKAKQFFEKVQNTLGEKDGELVIVANRKVK